MALDGIMVSALCITYNHEKYIEQALLGMVNQVTDFQYEIIVHDDASTDGTKRIIEKYAALYPDLIVPIYETENQYSKGEKAIGNIVFPRIRGKYIAYCEGDDYWSDDHKLQKQYDIMEQHPECSICVHEVSCMQEDGTPMVRSDGAPQKVGKPRNLPYGVIEKKQMSHEIWLGSGGYLFQTSSFFVRSEGYVDVWLSETSHFAEYMNGDMAIMHISNMLGNFYCMEDIMSQWRKGVPGSWVTRWSALSDLGKCKHFERQIMGEKLFDVYSEYYFHDYIVPMCFNLAAQCYVFYDPDKQRNLKKYKHYFRDNPLNLQTIHNKDDLWRYMRYLIMRISPRFYLLLCKAQAIITGKRDKW